MANRNEPGLEMANPSFSNSYVAFNFREKVMTTSPIPMGNEDSVISPGVEDDPIDPLVQFEEAELYDEGDSAPSSAPSVNTPESVKKPKLYELDEDAPNNTEEERKSIRKAKSCMKFRNKQKEEVNKLKSEVALLVEENKILRTQLEEKVKKIHRLEAEIQEKDEMLENLIFE